MASTLQDVVRFYQDRLILQYRGLPKASATIAILVKQAVCDYITAQLQTAFDVATAVGPQLDILGKYVGVVRTIGPVASVTTYGMERYGGGGNPNGFLRYNGTTNTGVVWMRYGYSQQNVTALTDAAFRVVIQLKILLNVNDGTLATIMAYLETFFPGQITLVDNANMSLTYTVSPSVPLAISTITPFLPKPMGVGITVNSPSASDVRVLSDGSTIRVLSDGSTQRVVI